jgi:photosystem II stability/assembly factor-like uncharacterized protein
MGMLKSSDGGSSWSSLDLRRKVGGGSQDPLAVDPFTTTRVYLGDSWFIDEPRTAPSVWVSENGGGDWRVVTMTVPSAPAGWSAETLAVAPHPANPGQILAGVNVFPTDEPGFGSGGIFASTDYGEHWKELEFSQPISAVTGIVYAPSNPDTIYAGTGGAGLLKSIDGGQDWEVITSGQWSEGVISAIAVHPENADEIYLSEKGTVYFSEDGGETWASMGSPAWIGLLLFAPNNPSILYAAGNGGLFRSKDRGVWQPVAGIPNQADVLSIAAGMDGERVVFYIGSSSGTLPVEQRLAGRLGSEAIKNPGLGSIMSGGVYRKTSLAHLMYLPLAPQSINK